MELADTQILLKLDNCMLATEHVMATGFSKVYQIVSTMELLCSYYSLYYSSYYSSMFPLRKHSIKIKNIATQSSLNMTRILLLKLILIYHYLRSKTVRNW